MFHVYRAESPDERARWLAAWEASPGREPSCHPTYVELFARAGERARLAHYQAAGGAVLYPFIQRPISALPWAAGDARCDLSSPYGYGGPYADGDAVGSAPDFFTELDAWAQAEGVVSSFTRLSLFDDELPQLPSAPSPRFGNVVRDLELSEDELWRDYAHKVRKNVKRAEAAGLSVSVDHGFDTLEAFINIYTSTMERRAASESFYFGAEFFTRLVRELPQGVVLFNVWHDGEIISTELTLRSTKTLYSFLGGTRAEHFELRPNDLLKHRAILWAKSQGLLRYVLGGGYGSEDGIYRYKLAFAPHGSRPFQVLNRTHDAEAEALLLALRRRAEPGWEPQPGFFPSYRG